MLNIFKPNTDKLDSFYEKGKLTLAWRLCVIFGIAFLILSIVSINSIIEEMLTFVLCFLISVASLIVLHRTNKYQFVYYFLSISGTIIAVYTANSFSTLIHIGDFLWMILIITISFFGVGRKFGLIILTIHLLNISYYTLFSVNDNIVDLLQLDLAGRISLMVEMIAATTAISYVIIQFLIFHNYSFENVSKSNDELSEQNMMIQKQHSEKSVLIKEVHHRVKNNLQIVISLLRLQQNEITSLETKRHFNEAINRILAMALIHQKLYQDETLADIKVKDYLIELKNEIVKLGPLDIPIEIDINSEIKRIGLKTIVPLGLIVNELLSNSMEHAFTGKSTGNINIHLSFVGQESFKLEYSDNGEWKDQSEDKLSFGLELVEALTSQLDGSFQKEISKNRTSFTFILKDLDIEK